MKLPKILNNFIMPKVTKFQLITENGNGFYSWNGDLYQSDIIRACIRPFSNAVGKLKAIHVRRIDNDIKINPDDYIRFLLEDPNPLMSGQLLQEKLAIQLKLNNNAFACIFRDEFGYATEIYPLPAYNVEALYDDNKQLFLKFNLLNGKTPIFQYTDIIHLRQDYNENDIFGDSPIRTITPLMEIVNINDQAVINAVKNSNEAKWLLRFSERLNEKDTIDYINRFNRNYLNVETGHSGVIAVDAKIEDIKQIEPKDYIPNSSIMQKTLTRITNFFGTNENIIQSKFTESEGISYFEAEIKPVSTQLSNEFTEKIFSSRERELGNSIIFTASSLQYASRTTKLNFCKMVDVGAMTPNEWREIMSLSPINGGDEAIRRLDTI